MSKPDSGDIHSANGEMQLGCIVGTLRNGYPFNKGIFMKTMTCRQLGGACDLEFKAETFEEMVELSKAHGVQMFQQKDADHLKVMEAMREKMQQPDAMTKWFNERRADFDAQAED